MRAEPAGCGWGIRGSRRRAVRRVFLVRHGALALELHAPGRQPIIVGTLREGEVLDGSWLVPPYRWAFDARALDLTRLLGVNAKCLRDSRSTKPGRSLAA